MSASDRIPLTETQPASLCDVLTRSAHLFPDRTALVDGQKAMSYVELEGEVAHKAAGLIHTGIEPGTRVGICFQRGIPQIIALLSVLRCGASYVSLDPAYPQERLDHVIGDSGVDHVVTDSGSAAPLGQAGVRLVDWATVGGDSPLPEVSSSHEAYIIYTSGSTGVPKGCSISHRNVVSLLRGALPLFDLSEHDRWTQFHSVNFDFSVWEMWGALATGASLHVVPPAVAATPHRFFDLLGTHRITVVNQVPSVFRFLTDDLDGRVELPDLRYLVFGGESVDLNGVARFHDIAGGKHVRYVNMYGITETTVHATYKLLNPMPGTPTHHSPIGRPLPHLSISLRDEKGSEVESGETGEIFVAGAGLSSGYLNRPELTAERFVTLGGTRYYRSGDLAFAGPDGEFFYVGRNDNQFKHRGFRIEAAEVEAALHALDCVKVAAVTLAGDPFGGTVLVACCVPAGGAFDPVGVRSELHRRLPGHMVPERILVVDRLPASPSGKLDRRRLAAIAAASTGHAMS